MDLNHELRFEDFWKPTRREVTVRYSCKGVRRWVWRTCLQILSSESGLWRTRSGDFDEVREKLTRGCSFSERSYKTSQYRPLWGRTTETTHHGEMLRTFCNL